MKGNPRSRCEILKRIDQISFAVDDLLLYLDTHPRDEKALIYCRELVQERKKLLQEYAQIYGPLTITVQTAHQKTAGNGWNSHSHGKRKEGADSLCGIMKKGFSIL